MTLYIAERSSSSPAGVDVSSLATVDRRTAGSPLDLKEGLGVTPRTSCERWPPLLRLRSTGGQLVRGRCKATNLCAACAMAVAIENVEMLQLDSMLESPQTLVVLTTPVATLDTDVFRARRRVLAKALKRSLGTFRRASILEYTTGYGSRAGGEQRPHWNYLVKEHGAEAHEAIREVIERVWCYGGGPVIEAQHVGSIYSAGGLTRYLAMHFQKAAQTPPPGFRGQRFNCSPDYPADGITRREWREQARESLRGKQRLFRAMRGGYQGAEAEVVAEFERLAQEQRRWELVVTGINDETGELTGLRRLDGSEPDTLRRPRGLPLLATASTGLLDDVVEYDNGQKTYPLGGWTRGDEQSSFRVPDNGRD